MFKNYFRTACRNILSHRATSIINITGLEFGICACLIIFLITSFEFSYDKFHADGERIYRVPGKLQHINGEEIKATADILGNKVTGFVNVAGFFVYETTLKVPTGNNIIVAEPQYFDIFKYQWLAGNATSLNEPFKVVLSKTEAKRYFGHMPLEIIVGKQIFYNDSLQLAVSGIVNNWKGHSDFEFKDFILWATIRENFLKFKINLSKWGNWDIANQVFVKLPKNLKPEQLTVQLNQFSKGYLKHDFAKSERNIFFTTWTKRILTQIIYHISVFRFAALYYRHVESSYSKSCKMFENGVTIT